MNLETLQVGWICFEESIWVVQGVNSGVFHAISETVVVQLCTPHWEFNLLARELPNPRQLDNLVWFCFTMFRASSRKTRRLGISLWLGLGTSGDFCCHVWKLMLVVGCALIWTVLQTPTLWPLLMIYHSSLDFSQHGRWVQELSAQERMRQKCLAFLWSSYHQFGYTLVVRESLRFTLLQRRGNIDPINWVKVMPICHFKKTMEDVRYWCNHLWKIQSASRKRANFSLSRAFYFFQHIIDALIFLK